MEDIFKKEICPFCKKNNCINCNGSIVFYESNSTIKTIYCTNYAKNEAKIIPYQKPLEVTAKRNYVKNYEV